MLPYQVISLATLTLNASGKIDRHKLLKDHESHHATLGAIPLRSETERRLVEVWRAVLGHDTFALGSNFFEVGGTSLTTFPVIAQVRHAFELERHQLPGNAIYGLPTIEALASYIDGCE